MYIEKRGAGITYACQRHGHNMNNKDTTTTKNFCVALHTYAYPILQSCFFVFEGCLPSLSVACKQIPYSKTFSPEMTRHSQLMN